jgi:hypothetical protein
VWGLTCSTPDFLTPAEQCFAVEYDHNKVGAPALIL